MRTAQINSPGFSYQTAPPATTTPPATLDDFRAVRGSYAGSFSGKSRQPIWIAVGMIAVVGGIAVGANMYSVPPSRASTQTVITPPEVMPPSPAIVEPTPTPQPIIIDPPAVPAPAIVPTLPSVEPPKM